MFEICYLLYIEEKLKLLTIKNENICKTHSNHTQTQQFVEFAVSPRLSPLPLCFGDYSGYSKGENKDTLARVNITLLGKTKQKTTRQHLADRDQARDDGCHQPYDRCKQRSRTQYS